MRIMIDIGSNTTTLNAAILENYINWILNFLKLTGMTLGSILLMVFIVYLIINILLSILGEIFPFIKGIIRLLEYILFPGSLMHVVWHVYAAKKLNYTTEQQVVFSWGWTRTGIKVNQPFKNMREGIIFFWAPLMNIPIIIAWVIPGMYLFQWLDTLIGKDVFYWIWLYILFSLVMQGLPNIVDLFAPLQISVIKVPEFYLFVVFYVIIAPMTLILWGWGITVIFSLLYGISMFYAVNKISRKESDRLSLVFHKYFSKKEERTTTSPPTVVIIPPNYDYDD